MTYPNLFDLRGRNALVTGSSRGIGRALALALANAGANVVVHASAAADALDKTVSEARALSVHAVGLVADLSEENAAATLYQQTLERVSQLDILICNASIQIPEPWLETTKEHFSKQVRINFQSTFELMQLAAPAMAERGWGRIVTVGSVQETCPHRLMPVYAATKCAQTSLVRSLAPQLAPMGVTVNNIAPGVIHTDRNDASLNDETYRQTIISKIPAARIGSPDDCTGAALLLCSEAGAYITGQSLYVDGGMSL